MSIVLRPPRFRSEIPKRSFNTGSRNRLTAGERLRVGFVARQGRRNDRGMTLIEIMIVVFLIAVLTGTLLFGSGMFTGANRRAAASLVVAGVRKGLAHANTTGKPVRLAMNLDSGRLILEESSSSEALRADPNAEVEEEVPVDPGAALLADAEAMAEQILSGAPGTSNSFTPVDLLGSDGETPGRDIGSGIRFVKVQTEHDDEATENGTAYIYFWPGGVTERAIVQVVQRSDDLDEGLTVVVSPLTGRAEIKRGRIELPEELFDDEDYSERDEP